MSELPVLPDGFAFYVRFYQGELQLTLLDQRPSAAAKFRKENGITEGSMSDRDLINVGINVGSYSSTSKRKIKRKARDWAKTCWLVNDFDPYKTVPAVELR